MLAVSMSPPIVHYSTVQKRPKLSLQTAQLPITYGTSSRGLSTIATPTAAVTPTTINTFSNTYDLTHRPSPTSTIASPLITRSSSGRHRISRSQSPRPHQNDVAYTVSLPFGVKPILKNTPYPSVRTGSVSASPRGSTRRVFFPTPKQVIFKKIIEEEVVTTVYTARHSDLFQQELDPKIERKDQIPTDSKMDDDSATSEQARIGSSIISSSVTQRTPSRRDSLDLTSRAPSPLSLVSSILPASTPSSTRKRRKWEWTLTPLEPELQVHSIHLPSQQPTLSASQSTSTLTSTPSISGSNLVTLSSFQTSYTSQLETECAIPTLAQPQPQPAPTTNSGQQPALSRSQTPSTASSTATASSSSSTQKRASSLDSALDLSPRKRKANCLEKTTSGLQTTLDIETTIDDSADNDSHTTTHSTGQTGTSRRERAATL